MDTKITATELARSLSDVLNRVRYRGERFVVERNGEPVATVAPVGSTPGVSGRDLARLLAELPWPDSDYFRDLEVIQASQPPMAVYDPWES